MFDKTIFDKTMFDKKAKVILFIGMVIALFIYTRGWMPKRIERETQAKSLCNVEIFRTIENNGLSQSPYITGCSIEDRQKALTNWCKANKDEQVCNRSTLLIGN